MVEGHLHLMARVVAAVKRPVRAVWRNLLLRQATDVTRGCETRSALVVAPHPDDETIGCGALIARKRAAGTPVHVVVVCDGRSSHASSKVIGPDELVAIRAAEVTEACRRLGVDDGALTLLGHPDESTTERHDPIAEKLRSLVDELEPDEVYLPSPLDWHPDHVAVNRAGWSALDAATSTPARFDYPVWYWAEGPWKNHPGDGRLQRASSLMTDPFTSLGTLEAVRISTSGFVEVKRHALAAYRSQRENLTGEASWATLPEAWFDPFLGDWELSLSRAQSARARSGGGSA
jgi:LmbE family N-acetylglucosaminyl deacetylase